MSLTADRDGPRRHPHIHTFHPGYFQNPGALGHRCSRGHNIVNQRNMTGRLFYVMPVESSTHIFPALFTTQT